MKIVLFLFICIAAISQTSAAQINGKGDSLIVGKYYTIGTKSNSQYQGMLLKVDSTTLVVKTSDGNLRLKLSDISIYRINKEYVETTVITERDTLKYITVEMKDNNEVTGYMVSKDSVTLILRTGSGVLMNIPVNQILSIKESDIEYEGGLYFIKDPNQSRLFVLPTARSIKGKTGYLSVVEVLFPILAFGIADYVTLAGGISLIPFSNSQLIYINTKVTPLQTKNADLAAGYMYLNATSNNSEGISIPYVVGTFGTKNASLTAGLGIGINKSNSSNPIILLGG